MLLYIHAFKDEPLIKIGIARDVAARAAALGDDRFNLAESYGRRAEVARCVGIERQVVTNWIAG